MRLYHLDFLKCWNRKVDQIITGPNSDLIRCKWHSYLGEHFIHALLYQWIKPLHGKSGRSVKQSLAIPGLQVQNSAINLSGLDTQKDTKCHWHDWENKRENICDCPEAVPPLASTHFTVHYRGALGVFLCHVPHRIFSQSCTISHKRAPPVKSNWTCDTWTRLPRWLWRRTGSNVNARGESCSSRNRDACLSGTCALPFTGKPIQTVTDLAAWGGFCKLVAPQKAKKKQSPKKNNVSRLYRYSEVTVRSCEAVCFCSAVDVAERCLSTRRSWMPEHTEWLREAVRHTLDAVSSAPRHASLSAQPPARLPPVMGALPIPGRSDFKPKHAADQCG